MRLLVPIGRVTTTRTRLPRVVATVQDDLGLRQVCERCNTFGRVGAIRTWTKHRVALLAQRLGPELYDKGLLGATRYPRYSLIYCVSAWRSDASPKRITRERHSSLTERTQRSA